MRRVHSRFAVRDSQWARGGFSLVELLTVVAIIALLVAILIPSLNRARIQAKVTDTKATLRALDGGLETFKADGTLGGGFPPSASDNPDHTTIANPLDGNPAFPGAVDKVKISGANLIVMSLMGADLLGTPGFADLNGDNLWSDDQHATKVSNIEGAYKLNAGSPARPRYGPFCDDSMTARVSTIRKLAGKSVERFPLSYWNQNAGGERDLPLFVDSLGHPILYYRARRAATLIVTDPSSSGVVGVYDYRDNQAFTGVDSDAVLFGPKTHAINMTTYPAATPYGVPETAGFAYYIWDPSVTARNAAVNRESYLLISAGPDGVYGTKDDVTNWRK